MKSNISNTRKRPCGRVRFAQDSRIYGGRETHSGFQDLDGPAGCTGSESEAHSYGWSKRLN